MKRSWAVLIAAVFLAATPAAALANGDEHHEEELAEPLFTEKAFLENEITLEVGYDNKDTEKEIEVGIGGSWIVLDRLQVGAEFPFGFREPDAGKGDQNLGDIEFSAKYLLYQAPENRLILSAGAEVAAPTGDGGKEIGGKGEWGLFVFAGSAVPLSELTPSLQGAPDLGVHFQFGYEQQIQLTDEQREEAEELGVADVLEKELIWRLAFNAKLSEGAVTPVFELLGKTIIHAIEEAEEGTIFEIGGGLWLKPFVLLARASGDKSLLSLEDLSFGIAAKGPVTDRRESNHSLLFVFKYELPR